MWTSVRFYNLSFVIYNVCASALIPHLCKWILLNDLLFFFEEQLWLYCIKRLYNWVSSSHIVTSSVLSRSSNFMIRLEFSVSSRISEFDYGKAYSKNSYYVFLRKPNSCLVKQNTVTCGRYTKSFINAIRDYKLARGTTRLEFTIS